MRNLILGEIDIVSGGDRWGDEHRLAVTAPADLTLEARNAAASKNGYAWDMVAKGSVLAGAGLIAIAAAPVAAAASLVIGSFALAGVGAVAVGAGGTWAYWGKERLVSTP